MLFKLSILVALVTPLVSALTVSAPSGPVNNGGQITFTWTTTDGDPATFTAWLTNPSFNNRYAIANSVDASLGTITLGVPAVPDNEQYTIILTPNDNAPNILAQSPPFTIGAESSTTTSATAASTSTARSSSRTGASTSTTRTLPTTSSFGTLVSATSTIPGSSGASSGASGASSATSAAASASNSNAAALPVRFSMNMGVVVSMALSIIAGAAFAF